MITFYTFDFHYFRAVCQLDLAVIEDTACYLILLLGNCSCLLSLAVNRGAVYTAGLITFNPHMDDSLPPSLFHICLCGLSTAAGT